MNTYNASVKIHNGKTHELNIYAKNEREAYEKTMMHMATTKDFYKIEDITITNNNRKEDKAMKEIYSFECGKQTEKDIKSFLGLPAEVSKKGQIDAVYNDYNIEIKRGHCILYAGKAFNRYRKANNAMQALLHSSMDTALLNSDKVAYSIDGTVEQTYIISTFRFLHYAEQTNALELLKMGKGNKQLRLYPNKKFLELLTCEELPGMTLTKWKELQDREG